MYIIICILYPPCAAQSTARAAETGGDHITSPRFFVLFVVKSKKGGIDMNDQHRANLRNAQDMLFKAQELIKAAYGIVEDAKREEEDYMSNLPEELKDSELYNEIELRVDTMDNLTDTLDDLADSAEEAGDMIDEVL